MLIGFVLFYVGVVLVINGFWFLGCIDGCEIVVINFVIVFVFGVVVLCDVFGFGVDVGLI